MTIFHCAGRVLIAAALICVSYGRAAEPRASKSKLPAVIKDQDVSDLLREINLSKSAETAVLTLRALTARDLTDSQRERIEKQIARFEEIQKLDQVRFGGKWVNREEARLAAKKADEIVSQAYEKLKNGDGKGTLAELEKACKANPDGIRAYFILGMLFSIRGNCNPFRAEDYFAEVVKRAPDHAPALNNLAICNIKTRKFGEAFAHFREAARIAPDSPELLQNVNRVVLETQQKQLPVPDGSKNKQKVTTRFDLFTRLAADLNARAEKTGRKFNPKVGWLFAPYVQTEQERDAGPEDVVDAPTPARGNLVPLGSGTGFAVAPDLLITNRHVIKIEQLGIADGVTVQLPDATPPIPPTAAKILAVSTKDDLALLKVEGGNYPAINISSKPLKRGREVLVLGYPHTDLFGASLKTTRGVITALEAKFNGMLMMDAEANPGNSGGPVCDRNGTLVGVMTAITKGGIGDYSFAVPSHKVYDFLIQNDLAIKLANDAEDQAIDWSEIDERLSPSVVLIETSYRSTPL
jgi:S1-C subfamily serine protease